MLRAEELREEIKRRTGIYVDIIEEPLNVKLVCGPYSRTMRDPTDLHSIYSDAYDLADEVDEKAFPIGKHAIVPSTARNGYRCVVCGHDMAMYRSKYDQLNDIYQLSLFYRHSCESFK